MDSSLQCRYCGAAVNGKYCSNCGAKASVSAITVHSILHEIFHYFTHLDKGFGYTFITLLTKPGTMQREYMAGDRVRHQKPFSMFFLCGTIGGLAFYLVSLAYLKLYGDPDDGAADFYRHYFILTQALMLPVYALVTWLVFKNQQYNFAETLVMTLYKLAFVFPAVALLNTSRLIFPDFDSRFAEIPFLLFYNILTNLRFYRGNKWAIAGQSVIAIGICYLCGQLFSSFLKTFLSH